MRDFVFIGFVALAGAAGLGCSSSNNGTEQPSGAGPTTPAAAEVVTFAAVHEELAEHCAGCHGPQGNVGAVNLSTAEAAYASLVGPKAKLKACGESGLALVVPGDPDASLLVQKLEGKQTCGGPMPPQKAGGPLPADDIEKIRAWVKAGAAR